MNKSTEISFHLLLNGQSDQNSMTIRILSAEDVRQALPMSAAIEGMKDAFAQLSTGHSDTPLRASVTVPSQDAVSLFMPAYMAQSDDLAIKIVSVFPKNPEKGEPMIYASVLVLDETSGRLLALIEGSELTAIRTGAGGGASAAVLARPDAKTVAILGSGVQARSGLEAVCTVRQIEEVRVYSPTTAHAETFAAEMGGHGPIPKKIIVADSPQAAVQNADIVYTATTSSTPTFSGADLAPGTHVIGVGSFTPQMVEVDAETIAKALVVVDAYDSAWAEAGELITAVESGTITKDHIHAELGEIIAGQKAGRTSPEQITFFKSVGVAVQDAVAGRIALQTAEKHNLGTVVNF